MISNLIIPLFFISICNAKRYDNYTLFRGIPVKKHDLEFFGNLSELYDVNYWRKPGLLRMPVDFVIGPNYKEQFLEEAKRNNVYLTTIMGDVQSAFDMQTVKSYVRRNMNTFDWQNYYKAKDIYTWLEDLEKIFPNEMYIECIGRTMEKRNILAVRILLKGSFRRSKVIIEGGIHAREWISPAFVTYMIHHILYSAKSKDKALRKMALTYEWYFVPILNPDGYEYTHKQDRLWRKNRNGAGVDLNRNFGYGFGTEGISFNKNSDLYCGKRAFSEKETHAMKKFVESKSDNLEYYLGFHSYGQYMIIPYTNSIKHEENYDEMYLMALRAAVKIRSFNDKKYEVGTAYDTVGYKVGGSSGCWVKKTFAVPYVLTFELRDEGNYGFALPVEQIVPTCEETMGGLITLLTPNRKTFVKLKHDYKLFYESHNENSRSMSRFDKNVILNLLLIIAVLV